MQKNHAASGKKSGEAPLMGHENGHSIVTQWVTPMSPKTIIRTASSLIWPASSHIS